jgi:hypothetical protein
MVKYKVDRNKGKKDESGKDLPPDIMDVEIPEIVIHTEKITGLASQKEGEVMHRINPNEVHGDGPNQGILPEFLPIARKWIEESSFENKETFVTKFADAELLSVVREKINKLPEGEDLTPRELRFLHEMHRLVTTFEVNTVSNNELEKLREARFQKLKGKAEVNLAIESKMTKRDFAKIFNVKPEEIFFVNRASDVYNIDENIKVLVVYGLGQQSLSEIDKIYGEMAEQGKTRGIKTIVGRMYSDELNHFPNLEEVTDRIMFAPNTKVKKVPVNLTRVKGFTHKKGVVLRELKKAEKAKSGSSWPHAFDSNKFRY